MEAPKRATKFAANDEWGKFYRRGELLSPRLLYGQKSRLQFGGSVWPGEDEPEPECSDRCHGRSHRKLCVSDEQGIYTPFFGAYLYFTDTTSVVPFELVKIRLQDKASAGKYSGMLDVITKTVRNEGVLAMYQGLESTLWRHILWNAGYFGCIFQVRQLLPKVDNKRAQMLNDILAGTVGGTIGTLLNTPMDVVKSRIQNETRVPGVVSKYNWAWPAVSTVLKEEGFGALYKGFLPKVLRLGPGGTFCFLFFNVYRLALTWLSTGGILLVVFQGTMDFFRKIREGRA